MELPTYKAEYYIYELNWYDWYALCIEIIQKEIINYKVSVKDIMEDNEICNIINMPLENYKQYCVKEFKAEIINGKLLFDSKIHVEAAVKWLKEELIPLNTIAKLVNS